MPGFRVTFTLTEEELKSHLKDELGVNGEEWWGAIRRAITNHGGEVFFGPRIPISKAKAFPEDSIPYLLAERLLSLIRCRDPKYKEPNLQSWASDFDKLIRLDEREPGEVYKVLCWSQSDSFWSKNILSPGKLREKYTALLLKMQESMPKKPTSRNEGPDGVVL